MAPLGGQEGVIVVEPADGQTDVEGGRGGVETEGRAGHARPVRHQGPGHDGPEMADTFGMAEREDGAAEGVHETVTRHSICLVTRALPFDDIVRDGLDLGVESPGLAHHPHPRCSIGTKARGSGPT
jgi:hypothetical protein